MKRATAEDSWRKEQQPHKKVLILGAGLSGIIAGKTLMDNGVDDFLILEGQDYIGGRIKKHSFAGFKIEEGANWIQFADEEESQPIWKLKKETDLKGVWTKYTYSDLIIRNETGSDITNTADFNSWDNVKSKYQSLQDERELNEEADISLHKGLALLGWESKNVAQKALEFLFTDYDFGSTTEKTSFSQFFVPEKEFFVKDPRGMLTLFEKNYKKFEEKIMLNKKVTQIKYDSKSVEVTTTDGGVFTADYGLCTFSTGVLASDMVKFSPPLPEWKREAILKMPMSIYTKIFLKFPYKFWDDKEYILLASNKKGFFPVFQDLEKPGKFPEGSGMLLITVTDDEGRRIEKQSFEKTKAEIVEMLRGVYGPDVPEPTDSKETGNELFTHGIVGLFSLTHHLPPHNSMRRKVRSQSSFAFCEEDTTDIFYPRWFTNPFTRGSFTYFPLGTTSEDITNLAMNLENLYFAGEGTSVDWCGYMQGAYLTGQEKARRISSVIKQRETESWTSRCG